MAISSSSTDRTRSGGYLFGVPVGELGWFATMLMSLATGFAGFFAGTFLGIVSLMIYSTSSHHTVDYSISYRLIGLPLGVLLLVIALVYLGSLRVKRAMRGA